MEEVLTFLQASLAESVTELLADYSLTAVLEPVDPGGYDLAAVLGYNGDTVVGNMAVAGTSDALILLKDTVQAVSVEDWLGEMGNQLLGRMKRKLGSHAVAITLGTPMLVSGQHIRVVVSDPLHLVVRQCFSLAKGRVMTTIDMHLRENFVWSAETVQDDSIAEGDGFFF